ncbi:protein of unknown function [Methylorubrum extorquens]|uniref:Uncharacterized protein n=1 Tax=Methylorubrum extorquens TaxID=408 RepID=A0A2N9AME9_METEX|nr:protein of unknown function [Methylorubrum extorquens]
MSALRQGCYSLVQHLLPKLRTEYQLAEFRLIHLYVLNYCLVLLLAVRDFLATPISILAPTANITPRVRRNLA